MELVVVVVMTMVIGDYVIGGGGDVIDDYGAGSRSVDDDS